ncbi:MAG: rod-binding protein [Pseudomonadota bacterium]
MTIQPIDALGPRPALPEPSDRAANVARDFEAAMLTPMMDALLPKAEGAVWGGEGGKLWRGLYAEALAKSVAEAGGVGIADAVAGAINAREGAQQ